MTLLDLVDDLNSALKNRGLNLNIHTNPQSHGFVLPGELKITGFVNSPDEKNVVIDLKYKGACFIGNELAFECDAGEMHQLQMDFIE